MSEFACSGYEVVPDVLSAADIDAMRDAIRETIDRVAAALRAPVSLSCPEAAVEDRLDRIAQKDRGYALALFRAVMCDAQRDPRLEALITHAKLTETVQQRLGPLRRTGQVIRTRALIPVFSGGMHPWHQDVVRPGDGGCGTVRLACWMPLSPVDERTGALEVIPGTWSAPLPHEAHADGVHRIVESEIPDSERRSVPLNAGDVLILDRFIPHRSLPVEHGRARWAVAMWVRATASID